MSVDNGSTINDSDWAIKQVQQGVQVDAMYFKLDMLQFNKGAKSKGFILASMT